MPFHAPLLEHVRHMELRIGSVVHAKFGKYGTFNGTVLTFVYEEGEVSILDDDDECKMAFRFDIENRIADVQLSLGELSKEDYDYIYNDAISGFSVDAEAATRDMLYTLESLPLHTSLKDVEFSFVLLKHASIRTLLDDDDNDE